jgi:hypothetical protein
MSKKELCVIKSNNIYYLDIALRMMCWKVPMGSWI